MTPLEEWIEYLKSGVIRPDTTAPGLEEARRKLIYYNMDRAEQLAYDEHINAVMIQNDVLSTAAEEGRIEGWQKGLQEGLEKGRQEEKRENARSMKSLNVPVDVIRQVTGLSIEEIGKLKPKQSGSEVKEMSLKAIYKTFGVHFGFAVVSTVIGVIGGQSMML